MTKLQEKIIDTYEQTKQTKVVYLSVRKLAKKVGCSIRYANKTINEYKKKM